jgi:hypothetical protein
MTLSHNKLKKQKQELGERPKLISLKAISKRGWQRARAKQKRKQVSIKV